MRFVRKKNDKYVKVWKHIEVNTNGEIPLAILEEMESNETTVSINGDRFFYLVREGKLLRLFKNIFLCLNTTVTLVVVIIMWNLSYITTLFLILVKHFGQVHLLLPQSVPLYPKLYVKEKVMNYLIKWKRR
jgi:hypothetical protein